MRYIFSVLFALALATGCKSPPPAEDATNDDAAASVNLPADVSLSDDVSPVVEVVP